MGSIEWLHIILGLFYFAVLTYFFYGIYRIPGIRSYQRRTVSVLVPARNEATHILNCLQSLASQTYPLEFFEVLVIDDQSTDGTAEVVQEFIKDKPHFKLLKHNPETLRPTYKKEALKFALKEVDSEIVMTIDADTVAQRDWIEKMVSHFDDRIGLVAGLVTFHRKEERSVFHRMQTLEFAGIVFCGVGSLGMNRPIMCNGSNLAYRKQAFEEAGGYDGNLHLASGDDDLLLQNIHKKTDWKVTYSLDPDTINYTHPAPSLSAFLNQRSRWASKSLHYPSKWIIPLLLMIYVFYFLTFILFPLAFFKLYPFSSYLVAAALKLIPEILIISKALDILGRQDLLPLFFPTQFFQVPYILYVGVRGLFKKFNWKNSGNGGS
ncbi:MAG: glycosyltransferase [Calditrichia bacterium]